MKIIKTRVQRFDFSGNRFPTENRKTFGLRKEYDTGDHRVSSVSNEQIDNHTVQFGCNSEGKPTLCDANMIPITAESMRFTVLENDRLIIESDKISATHSDLVPEPASDKKSVKYAGQITPSNGRLFDSYDISPNTGHFKMPCELYANNDEERNKAKQFLKYLLKKFSPFIDNLEPEEIEGTSTVAFDIPSQQERIKQDFPDESKS